MDTKFAQAIIKVIELPHDAQREIGEALLFSSAQRTLPVIELGGELTSDVA